MGSKIRNFSLAILVPTLFALMCLGLCALLDWGTPQDQVFEKPMPGQVEKVVQGPCSPEYAKAIVTPLTTSAVWKEYMEFLAPDGHTRWCIYVLGQKPDRWKFSPDGRYLYTFTGLTHSWTYDVYQLSTGKDVCYAFWDLDGYYESNNCPLIRMADGRWWSDARPNVVLKTNDPKLWNLVNAHAHVDPMLSPDGEWVVGKSTEWFFASSDGKRIEQFSMPHSTQQTPSCKGVAGLVAWRDDSKEFAVLQESDRVVFVWTIQDNGSIHQDDAMLLDKCTGVLKYTPDGNIITN